MIRYKQQNRIAYWFGCVKCGFKPIRIEELSHEDRWSVYRNGKCPTCNIELTKNEFIK